jgi:hypothetical protein
MRFRRSEERPRDSGRAVFIGVSSLLFADLDRDRAPG